MIVITLKAQKYLNLIISKQIKKNIRISVNFPGTEYAECNLSYNSISDFKKNDIEIKYKYFSIYFNDSIVMYLKDSKIDLVDDQLGQQLILIAPNVKNSFNGSDNNICKDKIKESILFKKIQSFIEHNINPMLSMHGGKVILVNIINQYILVKFLGGCNGCSMSHITLKQNIEKEIIQNFKDIKGVKDITKHVRNENSFI